MVGHHFKGRTRVIWAERTATVRGRSRNVGAIVKRDASAHGYGSKSRIIVPIIPKSKRTTANTQKTTPL
jgi:hypothetical protein